MCYTDIVKTGKYYTVKAAKRRSQGFLPAADEGLSGKEWAVWQSAADWRRGLSDRNIKK